MEYIIYTDGSCKEQANRAASSYIIRTKGKLIKVDVSAFIGVYIFDAELNAVSMALKALIKEVSLNKGDSIVVNIDSMDVIDYCRSIHDGRKVQYTRSFRDLSSSISTIKKNNVNIRFKKVHAHKDGMNTNKFVDRLAKCGVKHLDLCMR